MILLLAISLIALFYSTLTRRIYEFTFLTLLTLPLLAVLLSKLSVSFKLSIYISLLLIQLLVALFFNFSFQNPFRKKNFAFQIGPLTIFFISYVCFYELCLLWPDFYPIGERLRDYSLLSAVINNPTFPIEPWFAGERLGYYIYWYRFGAVLSNLLEIETWVVYHSLAAFSLAFYASSIYAALKVVLKFNSISSFCFTVAIAVGSNFSGIKHFYLEDKNWWGPSRVIKGAINEFPAWSFLLGDLHPHFLNLGFIPFAFLLLSRAIPHCFSLERHILLAIFAFITMPLWLFTANAWEAPIWIIFLFSLIFAAVNFKSLKNIKKSELFDKLKFSQNALVLLSFLLILSISLFLMKKEISVESYPFKLVKAPIIRTNLSELGLHFGVPLVIIFFGAIFTAQTIFERFFSALLAVPLFFSSEALWVLLPLFGTICFRICNRKNVAEALGVTAIFLLILPETIFMDDPYGGENERMNTIFKIYSSNWYFLNLYAIYMLGSLYEKFKESFPKISYITYPLGIAFLIVLSGFFSDTTKIRSFKGTVMQPKERGLSQIESEFAGAAETIKKLGDAQEGVVLEAQGNPYSYTSAISTLAGKQSYLGWINHINLLYKAYAETERRNNVTKEIYLDNFCENKRTLLQKENIRYVILGPLERKAYPALNSQSFNCLKIISNYGDFLIYEFN
ncbi:MAG TPA: DUF2298 domain-containing protein [Oligoflexia bacterium]|nr:DUF2298 domain-containing protein [Oligoflexia bacterium]HMP26923.1 DUF2298 domain-containing protein [Oligoflexia bacterium]